MSLVSCGFQGFDSKCSLDGGCSNKSPDERCSLSKIKWRYQEAGIPTTTDYNVYKKVSDLYDSYMDVKKKKSWKSKRRGRREERVTAQVRKERERI